MTPHSPLEAMGEFLDRIAPFDPEPHGRPAVTVEFRQGHRRASFTLSEHAASDQHLTCRDCGHVNGVFGAVLLEYAGYVAARGDGLN